MSLLMHSTWPRNDFVLPAAVDDKKHERSPEYRATIGDDSVIVLDDDDDDDVQYENEKTIEPPNQTVVETVGQELMDLAADSAGISPRVAYYF